MYTHKYVIYLMSSNLSSGTIVSSFTFNWTAASYYIILYNNKGALFLIYYKRNVENILTVLIFKPSNKYYNSVPPKLYVLTVI